MEAFPFATQVTPKGYNLFTPKLPKNCWQIQEHLFKEKYPFLVISFRTTAPHSRLPPSYRIDVFPMLLVCFLSSSFLELATVNQPCVDIFLFTLYCWT